MPDVQILIADSNELAAAGMLYILEQGYSGKMGTIVRDVSALLAQLQTDKPSIVIIDPYTIDGLDMEDVVNLGKRHSKLYLLVIASVIDKDDLMPLIKSDMVAIITKNCSQREILAAMEAAFHGEKFLCNKIVDLLMANKSTKSGDPGANSLSEREIDIVGYIAEGLSTQEIGDKLHLSPHTVHSHRKNILKKLNARTPVELVVKAAKAKLISF